MLQQAARRATAALLGRIATLEAAVPAATRSLATAPPQRPSEDDDDAFELLPPGCSLKVRRRVEAGDTAPLLGCWGQGHCCRRRRWRRPAELASAAHPLLPAALPCRTPHMAAASVPTATGTLRAGFAAPAPQPQAGGISKALARPVRALVALLR